MELYESSNLPVHYETLAKAIGVSKWTAYDMLKQLEKLNLLKKEYIVNKSETGRSQIVYFPSDEAYDIFKKTSEEILTDAEWEQVKIELMELLRDLNQKDPKIVSQRILDNISKTNNKVVLCANVISLLMTHVKLSNETKIPNIMHLIDLVNEDHIKLTLFTGIIVGMFLTELNNLGVEVMGLVSEHINIFGRLSLEDQNKVALFLKEILSM